MDSRLSSEGDGCFSRIRLLTRRCQTQRYQHLAVVLFPDEMYENTYLMTGSTVGAGMSSDIQHVHVPIGVKTSQMSNVLFRYKI